MNNRNLLIFELNNLYQILLELSEYLKLNVIKISKNEIIDSKIKNLTSYLIITEEDLKIKNQIFLNKRPVKISKLIELINIKFLKMEFSQKSEIVVGSYKIDLNSRYIYKNNLNLKLTEKEIKFIIYLSKNDKPTTVKELQSKVWGHQSQLETHTVETHIYRLRKKLMKIFNDQNFIISTSLGYEIK
jgi:hypothetical protein